MKSAKRGKSMLTLRAQSRIPVTYKIGRKSMKEIYHREGIGHRGFNDNLSLRGAV